MKQTEEHKVIWKSHIENLKCKLDDYIPQIYQSNYDAVIIEPRIHQDLEVVIKNVMYFLNETNSDIKWGLHIFHGNKNKEYVESITKDLDNVKLTNILFHDLSPYEYNDWVRTLKFWNQITVDNVLMFQTDSCLLRSGIDDFINWEYIGAPWKKSKEGKYVGNGGLSFRKTQKMIDIIKNNLYIDYINEDIYFSKFTNNLPPINTAKQFSVEDIYYDNPIGVHQPKIDTEKLKSLLDRSIEQIV